MIVFVSSSAAEPLSDALWGLSRPSALRAVKDTRYLFSWVDDLEGKRWLLVDTEYTVQVRPEAELDGIAGILQPWIDAGHLPDGTNETLTGLIEQHRGGELVVYEAFPDLFKLPTADHPEGLAKTREQMIEAGLLAQLSTP